MARGGINRVLVIETRENQLPPQSTQYAWNWETPYIHTTLSRKTINL